MREQPPPTTEEKERLSRKILVADDESSLRQAYRIILTKMGHQVELVENGQALLDKLNSDKYDLVISDNNMPIMSGVEALKQIRSNESLANIPVIVCSADYYIQENVQKMGAVFLKKPASLDEIREAVESALTVSSE